MKHITLVEALLTQDMGQKGADKICDAVLDDTFDASKDPVSAIIVKAFLDNNYIEYDSMVTDLSYAINQLQKAKNAIQKVATDATVSDIN